MKMRPYAPRRARQWLLLAFLASFLTAMAAYLPYMIRDGGVLILAADFNAEQLSFNMLCNNAVKQGEVLWNWRIDLGSDFVSSMSFYTLGSPFFWLGCLFPASWFPYLVGWLYMLKYATAGLTSFLYFRRYVREPSALIGSLLYAFSGFSCCVMVFYHFHEVIAFFPLLVLGLELLLEENRRGPFLLAVALNALVNYYFFVGEVIFLVIYYLIRYLFCMRRDFSAAGHLRRIGTCMLEGALGVGLASILFVPSVASILQNPRVGDHVSALTFDWPNYLQMLRALFFPAENMYNMSAVMHDNWYAIAAYLPMAGISLVLAYILRRKKDWLCLLFFVCLVIAASPVLNNMFVLFTSEPSRRWYYMPIFFAALASARVLDHPREYPWMKTLVISALCMAAITAYLWLNREEMFYRERWWFYITAVGFAGLLLLGLALWRHRSAWLRPALTVAVMGFAVATTVLNIHCYRSAYSKDAGLSGRDIYYNVVHTGDGLGAALPYRYHFWEHYSNRGMASYLPERNSFTSTLAPSVFELYEALGDPRHNISPEGPEGTNELLSVGYYVRIDTWPDPLFYTSFNGHETVNVYEDSHRLPIGFCYDTYMTRSELEAIEPAERAHAMLKTLVVADGDEATVKTTLRHYDEALDGAISRENKFSDMDKRREACSENFAWGTDFFASAIVSDTAQYAFYSVPYDKNWSAKVNGEPAEILNICGLMAVRVDAGENNIRFTYTPRALWLGIGVSGGCILLVIVYLLLTVRRKQGKISRVYTKKGDWHEGRNPGRGLRHPHQ